MESSQLNRVFLALINKFCRVHDKNNIEYLINERIVESSRIEFKASYNPAAVIRTICAFANDIDNMGGGYIIIGVEEENGHPKFPIKGIEKDKID